MFLSQERQKAWTHATVTLVWCFPHCLLVGVLLTSPTDFLMSERHRCYKPSLKELVWRKPRGATGKGCYRRSSLGQFVALHRVAVGSAGLMVSIHLMDLLFPLAAMLFLPSFRLSSITTSWEMPSGTAPSTLCIRYPALLFLHRILCDVYSLVYHLLPKTSRDLPFLFTTGPRTVPLTYVSRHSRNSW